ncbi:hypothetical protein Pcinc_023564 [Petrolisthes cinctipes]|uniref:Uncharacterized protein n=1 Tax=Petrolisthes cinctipes TaxID=88211 RepID=A0AAE1KF14_PETCI|nr:hypothetical protein Pcinc_023564 [Petrolisthes cinctipes]
MRECDGGGEVWCEVMYGGEGVRMEELMRVGSERTLKENMECSNFGYEVHARNEVQVNTPTLTFTLGRLLKTLKTPTLTFTLRHLLKTPTLAFTLGHLLKTPTLTFTLGHLLKTPTYSALKRVSRSKEGTL